MSDSVFFALLILFQGLFLFVGIKAWSGLTRFIAIQKELSKRNKEYKRRKKDLEERRKRGELNEWVSVAWASGEGIIQVTTCKNTGWCPELNGFIPLYYIEADLGRKEREAQYEEFRAEALRDLSEKYGKTAEEMEEIVEDVFSIKKDFALQYIDQQMKKLKDQIDENNKEIENGNANT